MIEHYILSNVPSWETIVGEGGGGLGVISSSGLSGRGSQSYGAVELVDVTDTETAGASTPLTGMQSDSDLTPGANNTDVHVEVSLPARIANRVTMVIMTTIIATWVPCFGMVYMDSYKSCLCLELKFTCVAIMLWLYR